MTKKNSKVINISEAAAEAKRTEIDRLLDLAREILESDCTIHSRALSSSILTWKKAIDGERLLRSLDRKITALEIEAGIVPSIETIRIVKERTGRKKKSATERED
jgi:hypothetical protein